MSSEEKRIEIRRIYVGKAALFGLLYGLIIGIILGLVLMITALMGTSKIPVIGERFAESVVLLSVIAFFGSIFFSAISVCIVMIISSLFYNLISLMGARLHLGMAEYGEVGIGGGMQPQMQMQGQGARMQSGIQGGVQIRV